MMIKRSVDVDKSGTKWWAVSHSQDGTPDRISCFNWFRSKTEADKYYFTLPGAKEVVSKSRCL